MRGVNPESHTTLHHWNSCPRLAKARWRTTSKSILSENTMTNLTFPKELASEMFDASVRFSKFIHIPTLDANQLNDDFRDFVDEYCEQYYETLAQTWDDLNIHIAEPDKFPDQAWMLAETLLDYCNKEFLICADVSIPQKFNFNEKGEFLNCNCGFGNYYQIWFFADSTVQAAKFAIDWAAKLFEQRMSHARKEQGLEG